MSMKHLSQRRRFSLQKWVIFPTIFNTNPNLMKKENTTITTTVHNENIPPPNSPPPDFHALRVSSHSISLPLASDDADNTSENTVFFTSIQCNHQLTIDEERVLDELFSVNDLESKRASPTTITSSSIASPPSSSRKTSTITDHDDESWCPFVHSIIPRGPTKQKDSFFLLCTSSTHSAAEATLHKEEFVSMLCNGQSRFFRNMTEEQRQQYAMNEEWQRQAHRENVKQALGMILKER